MLVNGKAKPPLGDSPRTDESSGTCATSAYATEASGSESPQRSFSNAPSTGQLLGPFTDPLQWLAIRHALASPSTYTADKLLTEFAGLEPELLRLFTLIQMAEGPAQQNTEIVLKNGKFYFRIGQLNSAPSSNDSDLEEKSSLSAGEEDKRDVKTDELKNEISESIIESSKDDANKNDLPTLYAWFSEELTARLPAPSVHCLNGVRRYFCALCNQVFCQPNPVVLHILFACSRREQLLPNGVNTPNKTTSSTASSSSSSTSSTASSTNPIPLPLPPPPSATTTTVPSGTPAFSAFSSSSAFTAPSVSRTEECKGPINFTSTDRTQAFARHSPPKPSPGKKRAFDIDSLVSQEPATQATESRPPGKRSNRSKDDSRSSAFKSKNVAPATIVSSPIEMSNGLSPLLNSLGQSTTSVYPSLDTSAFNLANGKVDPTKMATNPYGLGLGGALGGLGSQFELAALYAHHQRQLLQFLMPSMANNVPASVGQPNSANPSAAAAAAAAAAYGSSLTPFLPPQSLASGLNGLCPVSIANKVAPGNNANSSFSSLHGLTGLGGLPGLNNLNGLGNLNSLNGLGGLGGGLNSVFYAFNSLLPGMSGLTNIGGQPSPLAATSATSMFSSGTTPSAAITNTSASSSGSRVSDKPPSKKSKKAKDLKDHNNNQNVAGRSSTSPANKNSVLTAALTSGLTGVNPLPAASPAIVSSASALQVPPAGLSAEHFAAFNASVGLTPDTAAGDPKSLLSPQLLNFLPPSLAALSFPQSNWCAKCNTSFRMTSDLVYHMRSHHKEGVTGTTDGVSSKKKREENKLHCTICGEGFRERHHLTRHMTSHN